MDSITSKIVYLKEMVTAAQQEFDLAVAFHEVWRPTAYDEKLHGRMGTSYATQAFRVVRTALQREVVLALVRLWDTNKREPSVKMTVIRERVGDKAVIDALAIERVKGDTWPGVVDAMQHDLQVKATEVMKLTSKYMEGGSHHTLCKGLVKLRNERLAHRQVEPSSATGAAKLDDDIEEFYQDNGKLIRALVSLVNATSYDPMEAAKVYERYAAEFWAGARGEETEGHPHFRLRKR